MPRKFPANKKQKQTWYDFLEYQPPLQPSQPPARGTVQRLGFLAATGVRIRRCRTGRTVTDTTLMSAVIVLPPFPMGGLLISVATSQTTRNRVPPLPVLTTGLIPLLTAGLLLLPELPEGSRTTPFLLLRIMACDHTAAFPEALVAKLITGTENGILPLLRW